MSDKILIDDIITTMTKYGYNCDRSSLSMNIVLLLQFEREFRERLKAIEQASDLTKLFIFDQKPYIKEIN